MIEKLELTNTNLPKLRVNDNAANMQKVHRESAHKGNGQLHIYDHYE